MYCIECGSQITENAKFCSQCGSPLSLKPSNDSGKSTVSIDNINKQKKRLLPVYSRTLSGWYLLWILLNLGILLIFSEEIFSDTNLGADEFWPFGSFCDIDDASDYDITEFLFYTLFPIGLYTVWKILWVKESSQKNQQT